MLTEKRVREAKASGKAWTMWDEQVQGLGLQVTQAGKKNYVLRYRVAGRKKQVILARASEISVRNVRLLAGAELVRIRAGESDPLDRQRAAAEAPTVAEGLTRYFTDYAPRRVERGRMSPRTVSEYRKVSNRYVAPKLGARKVAQVNRRHVEVMVESLPRVQRNRVLAFTSVVFNLFETWEWRAQYTNPTRGVERALEEARDRVLSSVELAALAAALDQADDERPAAVAAIRVAALTGLRIGEVLGMRWEHVDFETGRLLLPSTKSGRRTHDLPGAAFAVLAASPESIHGSSRPGGRRR